MLLLRSVVYRHIPAWAWGWDSSWVAWWHSIGHPLSYELQIVFNYGSKETCVFLFTFFTVGDFLFWMTAILPGHFLEFETKIQSHTSLPWEISTRDTFSRYHWTFLRAVKKQLFKHSLIRMCRKSKSMSVKLEESLRNLKTPLPCDSQNSRPRFVLSQTSKKNFLTPPPKKKKKKKKKHKKKLPIKDYVCLKRWKENANSIPLSFFWILYFGVDIN